MMTTILIFVKSEQQESRGKSVQSPCSGRPSRVRQKRVSSEPPLTDPRHDSKASSRTFPSCAMHSGVNSLRFGL